MKQRVVVIGAGIVGICTAGELARDGHEVTLVETAEPAGEQAASYGNAGWFSTSSVVPLAMPGIAWKVPGYVLDPTGPMMIRRSYLPRLVPWLLGALAATRPSRIEAIAMALRALLQDAPERHARLATEAGADDLVSHNGCLYAYPEQKDFEADALGWKLRRDNGIVWRELSVAELREREPHLDARYRFGAIVESGAFCQNPAAYAKALLQRACGRGVNLVTAQATAIEIVGGRLKSVRTGEGEIACDRAVISAGARSAKLAAQIGDRVKLVAERGYHVAFNTHDAGPRQTVMLCDAKVIATRMQGGFRVAGQTEFADVEAPPDWNRAAILRDWAHRIFPGLKGRAGEDNVRMWMGPRPSTPDSLPCIGYSGATRDVVHAFGHGHVGLSSAPMTGRLVADLIAGRETAIDIAPFSPARF